MHREDSSEQHERLQMTKHKQTKIQGFPIVNRVFLFLNKDTLNCYCLCNSIAILLISPLIFINVLSMKQTRIGEPKGLQTENSICFCILFLYCCFIIILISFLYFKLYFFFAGRNYKMDYFLRLYLFSYFFCN